MRKFLIVATFAACGGSSEPPKTENDVTPQPSATHTGNHVSVQNEFGTIDEKQAAKLVNQLSAPGGPIQKCHTSNLKRVEFLGGGPKATGQTGHGQGMAVEGDAPGHRIALQLMPRRAPKRQHLLFQRRVIGNGQEIRL